MGDLDLRSPVTTLMELSSTVTSTLELTSILPSTTTLKSSVAGKNIDLVSRCETVLEQRSRVQTDYYGELEETEKLIKVIHEPVTPLQPRTIRPLRVAS